MAAHPLLLVILDGYGYRHVPTYNAIHAAHPAHLLDWQTRYPCALLQASGVHVGLLPHMIGNSEVGHLTLGAGRIITQPVSTLAKSIADGSFFSDPLLVSRFKELKKNGGRLHIMGLLSDAGVHSHSDHFKALIELASQQGLSTVIAHPFLDGRDVPPQSAATYLVMLENWLAQIPNGIIGTMHGRFYAMDRDTHWERTIRSYKVLTAPAIPRYDSWRQALVDSYAKHITDEFFVPVSVHAQSTIAPNDGIIFVNYREDRARQLTAMLLGLTAEKKVPCEWFITGTRYSPVFQTDILIERPRVQETVLDVVERAGKRIFTIAETEKYAHVTYFFNGGRELVRSGETRILIPSKRHFATYAFVPKMSAIQITDTLIHSLKHDLHDVYIINYANADMVGHSGDFNATVKAVACLDEQLARLYQEVAQFEHAVMLITADHGKAEEMWDIERNQPRTAHTVNPVPFMYIGQGPVSLQLHELADVAPFMLQILKLPVPSVMKKVS